MAAYLNFDGTELRFDAVMNEQTEGTSKATEHPVEDGPNVSDHIRDELDTITLEVTVTNQPIKDVNNLYGLDPSNVTSIDVEGIELVRQGVTLDVPKYRPFPITPGALMQTIGNAISDALSDDTVAQVYGKTESKTSSFGAQVQAWAAKFNAVTDVVGQLNEWREAGVVGEVITPWKTFPSMVITKVGTTRNASIGDAAVVSISLKEIRLVESKLVTAPVPTEERGKMNKPKGRQPTSFVREPTAKKKSLLRKATE